MENSTEEERLNWGIIDSELKSIIDVDEKYIYEVGKIDNKFITKSTSFINFKIIRNHILGLQDE